MNAHSQDATSLAAPDPQDGVLLVQDRPIAQGVVRLLTLNRPDKRNALNTALMRQLKGSFEAAEGDAAVRAVILTGSGPSFSSGGDLAEFQGTADPRTGTVERARLIGELQSLLPRLSVPVIAAARGAALGAGALLAASADMMIAEDDLTLGFPEIRDSTVPSLVMSAGIHRLGGKLAFEMFTTGRRLDAREAVQQGLANKVVAGGMSVNAAMEVAEHWAEVDAKALTETKRLFYRLADLTPDAAIQVGVDVTAAIWRPRA